MVKPLDFAELEGVHNQAGITVAREPNAVMLVGDFVAIADSILDDGPVPAQIQDRRQGLVDFFGQVEVGRDVKAGQGLKVEVLDHKIFALDFPGDFGFQIAAWRQGIEAEHLEQLFAVDVAVALELRGIRQCGDGAGCHEFGFGAEVVDAARIGRIGGEK
jgi:hypothetical protein